MRLPVFKQMSYISPSSFLTWRDCQYKTYLSKLSGLPYMPTLTTYATDVGTAFDAYIKDYIAKKKLVKGPHLHLDRMLGKIAGTDADAEGKKVAKIYISTGLVTPFLDATEIRLEQELLSRISGIPILGRIDMIVDGVPLDWKLRGFLKANAYPTKGYQKRFDYDINLDDFREVAAIEKLDFLINEPWRIQMLVYNWLLRNYPRKYIIHEVCKNKDKYIFVEHRGYIDKEFHAEILKQMDTMWNAITDSLYYAEIAVPRPAVFICEKWASLCERAVQCRYYKESLGDSERREFYT